MVILGLIFVLVLGIIVAVSVSVATALGHKMAAKKSKEDIDEEDVKEVVEEDTFDEEYLASVAKNSIDELCDFGMSEEEAVHFLDKLSLCTTEENYLFLIDSCQKKRVSLRDERVKVLSEKLEAKAAKGVNPDAIAMVRDCLENATSKEQLDRIEQHIAKLRASSKKPANVVKKPAPKKTKTA